MLIKLLASLLSLSAYLREGHQDYKTNEVYKYIINMRFFQIKIKLVLLAVAFQLIF